MVDGRDAVEAPDGEDHVIYDLDSEVAARVVHVGHGRPCVGPGVVHLAAAHAGYAVEAADNVNLKEQGR